MNNLISRQYDALNTYIRPKRVTIIYGPRRVGKTTLVENYLSAYPGRRILRASGDNISQREVLSSQEARHLLEWAATYDTIFVDEAQRIDGVGWGLKILIDARPELNIIVTGSSSFDLAGKLGEPLTGRRTPLLLYPVAIAELSRCMNDYELRQNLEDFMIFGMYPEVRTADTGQQKKMILNELTDAYLLKDILELERIKKPKTLVSLLTMLAFQVGSEVSLNELSNQLRVDIKTIARYLDLLEKCYIIYNLRGFSRNLRNEVTKKSKYYFYDLGIRNAVIQNFNPFTMRNDIGALWENFVIMERVKTRAYKELGGRDYFWRTWEKQEIDYLEENAGKIHACEFKWSPAKKSKAPQLFLNTYAQASFEVVNSENFLNFLIR
jgi:predicted AAA+ superfamily ATPase